MNEKAPKDILENNIRRLIATSGTKPRADFEWELAQTVLEEVHKERQSLRAKRLRRTVWAIGAAAVAAVIILAVNIWSPRAVSPKKPAPTKLAGRVKTLYGLVSVINGQAPQMVERIKDVRSGQWVETHSGSRAEILLANESKLFIEPRSLLQIADNITGQRIVLTKGVLGIEAGKQKPGELLTIETPGSEITVLGTKLEVHVVHKPDGNKQTRVSVTAGQVRMKSGGKEILLPANTEGVADEGQRPIRRSLTAEVNEMAHLVEKTRKLAAESGVPAGTPVIVEFNGDGSGTIWTNASIANKTTQPLGRYSLSSRLPVARIEAFSLQGSKLPVTSVANTWRCDLSGDPLSPGEERTVIVKVSGLRGLFEAKGSGTFQFSRSPARSAVLSLLQFRLPGSANVESITPKPIETRRTLSRLVVTVVVDFEPLQIFR